MTDLLHWFAEPSAAPVVCFAEAMNGLGFNSHQTWALRRADVRGLSESPFFLPDGTPLSMAHVRVLPRDDIGATRLYALLEQLMATPVAWLRGRVAPDRLGVALALAHRHHPDARPERFAKERTQLERAVIRFLEPVGSVKQIQVDAYGSAAPAFSLQALARKLADGEIDVGLVVAADTYYDPIVIEQLARERRLFDGKRQDGLVPGEGGAVVAIASPRWAREQGWRGVANLEAASIGREPIQPSTHPNLGEGLARTVSAISNRLAAEHRTVDWWIGDVSNEAHRQREFQLAFPRFSGVAHRDSRLEFLPEHLGDLGAATLPTGIAIALEGFRRGDPAASSCLLFASSDAADRGAVLLENPWATSVSA